MPGPAEQEEQLRANADRSRFDACDQENGIEKESDKDRHTAKMSKVPGTTAATIDGPRQTITSRMS